MGLPATALVGGGGPSGDTLAEPGTGLVLRLIVCVCVCVCVWVCVVVVVVAREARG
jgi:hypothetical protein